MINKYLNFLLVIFYVIFLYFDIINNSQKNIIMRFITGFSKKFFIK